MIFYSIHFLLFVACIFDLNKNLNIKYTVLLILSVILILFSGLRPISIDSYYYYDTQNYVNLFENLGSFSEFKKDIGYYFINLLASFISSNYTVLFIIISGITIIFTNKYIRYYTNRWILALLVYVSMFYYIREFGQIRASLAYAIVIYSSKYLIKNDNKKFLIGMFIATSIHFSAVLGIFIYFVRHKHIDSKVLYFIVLLSVLIFNVEWLGAISDVISGISDNFYIDKFNTYIRVGKMRSIDIKVIIYYTIAILSIYIRKYNKCDNNKFNMKLNMLIIGIVILAIFSESDILSVRLSELYITSIVLIIPEFVDLIENNILKVLISIIISLCLIIYTIRLFIGFGSGLVY